MKEGTKNIIAACILAFGMILCAVIFAYSSRYEIVSHYPYKYRVDRWTGTEIEVSENLP